MYRGEIWCAVRERPWLIVQSDEFNASAIPTLLCAALTDDLRLAEAPGNVRVSRRMTGLTQDAVVNIADIAAVGKQSLRRKTGRLSPATMRAVDVGLRLVLELSIR